MKHASFIEDPNREPSERPIMCATTGEELDSIFIQVTLKTFHTPEFQEWLKILTCTRATLDCETRIVILRGDTN